MDEHDCPFCCLDPGRVRVDTNHAAAFLDAFPVAEGHTLVIPKRHVVSLWDLPADEQTAVWDLVVLVRSLLATDLQPDGFNIGLNDGVAAGQTVPPAHVNVIPRPT